jgi:hypothetical protein
MASFHGSLTRMRWIVRYGYRFGGTTEISLWCGRASPTRGRLTRRRYPEGRWAASGAD